MTADPYTAVTVEVYGRSIYLTMLDSLMQAVGKSFVWPTGVTHKATTRRRIYVEIIFQYIICYKRHATHTARAIHVIQRSGKPIN